MVASRGPWGSNVLQEVGVALGAGFRQSGGRTEWITDGLSLPLPPSATNINIVGIDVIRVWVGGRGWQDHTGVVN